LGKKHNDQKGPQAENKVLLKTFLYSLFSYFENNIQKNQLSRNVKIMYFVAVQQPHSYVSNLINMTQTL